MVVGKYVSVGGALSAAEKFERWWPMLMCWLDGKMTGVPKNGFFARLALGWVHVRTIC